MFAAANKLLSVPLALLALATPTMAETGGEIEELRHRLAKLEAREKDREGFALFADSRSLKLFGALELEGTYADTAGRPAESDLAVATALLGVEADLSDRIRGRVVLLHEEGEEPAIDIDEAHLTLSRPESLGGKLFLRAGRDHLPFGAFPSAMISDPLTLDLGETDSTALLAGWESGKAALRLALFNGKRDSSGHDVIDNGVAALTISPGEHLAFGLSYLRDLAESNLGLLGEASAEYAHEVDAASAYLTLKLAQVTVNVEYLGSLRDFSETLLADPARAPELSGHKPRAWFGEVSFAASEDWAITGRYEKAKDYQDDVVRYGATVSYGLDDYTTLSLEYLHSDFDRVDQARDNQATAQLAVEF